MQIHYSNKTLPVFKNAIVTVGSFDGVHLGHQKILEQLKASAEKNLGESVLLSFYPHPRLLLQSSAPDILLLNTWEEKVALLTRQGVDHLVLIEFNATFAALEPEQYIREFLVEKIHPLKFIIGYDHRFGKGRTGDIHLLRKLAKSNNYEVEEIAEKILKDVTISSTKIRQALIDGEVAFAATLLGYHYRIQGKVVQGKQLGRTIGYPTANIKMEDANKLVPAGGVYAVLISIVGMDVDLKGMLNIGTNPTVNGQGLNIEVNIFDFDKDIYGEEINLSFIARLRDETKFDSIEALKQALAQDEESARKILR